MPDITLPDLPLTGGCQCGAVRYAIGSAPLTFYVCHCTDCQRQSGSAFGESLQVRVADLDAQGDTAAFERVAGSGRRMRCTFCPACGTRLWHARAEGSDFASLKAGTLDDTGWLRPAAHIFTASRQPWVALTPAPLAYEGRPDMEAMRRAFAAMLG
ncbi:GFA family protein [Citreimonas salinaria]|uniref:Uncharacterized conserved protein n=1 Tax=Citreimonas salinaria TaxID=321339 RepID=A0A1H3LBD7_9RHOB|nr:GFA family protein [Citreimonas salinaria]SDY61489.1 Uncharacterized conserved protein [Citreimonas salinaria]